MKQDNRDPRQLLNEALNEIDENMIEEASKIRRTKKVRWLPLAAAAVLAVTAAVALPAVINRSAKSPASNSAEFISTDSEKTKPAETEKTPVPTEEREKTSVDPGSDVREEPGYESAPEHLEIRDEYSYLFPITGMPGLSEKDEMDPAGEGDTGMITEPMIELPPADEPKETDPPATPDPGQLTAAAWNDNEHFTLWRALFKQEEQGSTAGKFVLFAESENAWFKELRHRTRVTVLNGADPVAGITLRLSEEAEGSPVLATAVTDANGVAYLFHQADGAYKIQADTGNEEQQFFTHQAAEDTEVVIDFSHVTEWAGWELAASPTAIDLMYVIDATGSMGDEITYLKSELSDVVQQVVTANPGVYVRLSFLTYRDDEDEEKFHFADFTDVSDEAGMRAILHELSLQDATGGGDYEEAVDEALALAVSKDWAEDSVKLVFHVLDAPAHDEPAHRERYERAVNTAAEKGIRICPILSSGSDEQTEYLARAEALLTGGTFIFLTDDSGIGYGHLDPQLPDAVHEYLNALMVRLINGYYTGKFADPVSWKAE